MPKIRNLVDVLQDFPDFKPGWNPIKAALPDGTERVIGLENTRYGRKEIVVVCGDDGKPMYDRPQITSGAARVDGTYPITSGANIVPFFKKEEEIYVGLLEVIRPLVIDPKTLEQGHYLTLEIPRGFGDLGENPNESALRELGEETGKIARKLYHIGRENPDTASFVTSGVNVYAAELDPVIGDSPHTDTKELVLRCHYNPYPEVRRKIANGEIYCGKTLSGLMLFDIFLEREGLR